MEATFEKSWFEAVPLVGILRGFGRSEIEQIVPAAMRGGLRQLEITMNSPGAPELIRRSRELAGKEMNIGAGTVLNLKDLDVALSAGALFIVTPVINEPVIRSCVKQGVPVFPGAFTPTEICRAWDLGAAMVKVFPADQLGPSYLKAVKAPLPHVKLMPTGGVNLETVAGYAGVADGFGVGSPLFAVERIRSGDWAWVEAQCRAFLRSVGELIRPG